MDVDAIDAHLSTIAECVNELVRTPCLSDEEAGEIAFNADEAIDAIRKLIKK